MQIKTYEKIIDLVYSSDIVKWDREYIIEIMKVEIVRINARHSAQRMYSHNWREKTKS